MSDQLEGHIWSICFAADQIEQADEPTCPDIGHNLLFSNFSLTTEMLTRLQLLSLQSTTCQLPQQRVGMEVWKDAQP